MFVVSTGITFYIVYRDIDNSFSFKFLVGYVIFLFLYLVYFIIATVINIRKLRWFDIGKRLYRFIASFVCLSGTSIIYYYFFKSTEIDYYRVFSPALGISLGISFFDLAFSNKKNED
ncbi:hypothetical protein BI350_05530 [Sporosarcina ureilytica]|uniref:Uncharacterized protein n=1 Tax=Sporosarcina ureilytica TaxID=298596 RepID=A0A1D8JK69_9BACL|nr:hypothetical protein BI350_05530 [Sporosarcina ureilytica]